MSDQERRDLERNLGGAMPGQLDLALPIAERLAALDHSRMPLLDDIGARLTAANRRHRALEDAFTGRALGALTFALSLVESNPDRRSDDEALMMLAGAELDRRQARQAELRKALAAVPRDHLDQALMILRQLSELEPDGDEGLEASALLITRARLIELHQYLTESMANPLQPGVRQLMHDLANAPRRLPDSPGVLERMAQAITQANKRRFQRRLRIGAVVTAIIVILAIAADLVLRQRRALAAATGQTP